MIINDARKWSGYGIAAAAGLLVVSLAITSASRAKTQPPARVRHNYQGGIVPSASAKAVSGLGKKLSGPALDTWKSMRNSFSSADDASKELTFTLKMSKSNAVGKLFGIFTAKGSDDRAEILYYDPANGMNGISITAEKLKQPYDPQAWVDQMILWKQKGWSKGDSVPYLVDVNGVPGNGLEPGYNLIAGGKEPRPGSVSWEDNGVLYTVYGTPGEQGTSVNDLLEIARSMS